MRTMLTPIVILFAVCAATQETLPLRMPLRAVDAHEVPETSAGPLRYPIKCGSGGSLYFRTYAGPQQVPITRVGPDGHERKMIGLSGTAYADKARIADFFPLPRGGVLLLVFDRLAKLAPGEYRLLDFSDDGTLRHDTKLDLAFDPQHLAVFDNGEVLLAGRKPTSQGGGTGDPVMAIVDASGRVIRTVSATGELTVQEVKNWPKDGTGTEGLTNKERYDMALDLSIAETGDDGNVYLLRRGPEGPLFQVTPAGVVHAIPLPPLASATLMNVKIASGNLLLQYAERSSKALTYVYRILDLSTFDVKAEYSDGGPAYLGSALACYTLDGLTFVTRTGTQGLKIVAAKP